MPEQFPAVSSSLLIGGKVGHRVRGVDTTGKSFHENRRLLPGTLATVFRGAHWEPERFPHFDPLRRLQKVTEYLLAGHEIYSFMGSSKDVLGSGRTILGGDSIYSDGEWLWRGDLWFYVRTYHVTLPVEFLAQVRKNEYLVPAENEPQLMEIAKCVQKNL
ncbi:hypothetical protein ABZ370_00950 [Streptomyces sp. NPDC005962]|uniref:hypothetical protein n=1 Tax=Streptomyces sp. NPDC005962 TaxID=3154466 RepID=UPI0033DDB4F2